MRFRFILLTFVSVLLIGSLAGAATADPAGSPAAPAAVAPVAAAAPFMTAAPLCGETSSTAALPSGNPLQLRSFVEPCGVCSVAACRGAYIGAGGCSRTNPTAKCYDSDGPHCSADGLTRCLCGSPP